MTDQDWMPSVRPGALEGLKTSQQAHAPNGQLEDIEIFTFLALMCKVIESL